MRSLPNRRLPSCSRSSHDVPAKAASQPRIRSSSTAWPTDSWIWSAICSEPMIRSVASRLGHCGAVSSSRASSAIAWRVGQQVQLAHDLPAARAELPADARIAAPLRLGLAVHRRLHRRAALADALVDAMALGRGQPLRRVPHVVAGQRDVGAVLLHRPRGADEQVPLLGQRHAQRILVDRVLPVVGARLDRGQLEVRARDRCAGASDRRRLRPGLPRALDAEVGGREEAPSRADQRPDTEPDRSLLGERPRSRRCARSSTRGAGP